MSALVLVPAPALGLGLALALVLVRVDCREDRSWGRGWCRGGGRRWEGCHRPLEVAPRERRGGGGGDDDEGDDGKVKKELHKSSKIGSRRELIDQVDKVLTSVVVLEERFLGDI